MNNCYIIATFLGLITNSLGLYAQTLNASFSADLTQGCSPLFVNFSNTSTGALTFEWDFDNNFSSNLTNPSTTFYNPGKKYSVQLVAFDSLGNSDTSITIIDVPFSKPYFNIPEEACPGEVVEFSVAGNPNAFNNVIWEFGDAFSNYTQLAHHSYSDTGIYTATMTVYNSICGTTTEAHQIIITKSIFPDAHIHPEFAKTTICPNENFPFFYDENHSVLWDFGDGNFSSDPYPTHSYMDVGEYTVHVSVTNECSNTSYEDTVIYVLDNVKPQALFSFNDTLFCPNEMVECTAQLTDGYTYNWFFDDGFKVIGPVAKHAFQSIGYHKVKLDVTNKCGLSDTYEDSIFISNIIAPESWIKITNKIACPLDSIEFYTSNSDYIFYWEFGDGNTSSIRLPKHVYEQPGTYPIKLSISNQCGLSSIYTDTVKITSTLKPNSEFYTSQNKTCKGGEIFFTYLNSNNSNILLWSFGNGSTSNSTNPIVNYQDTGIYEVILKVTNGCNITDSSAQSIVIDTTSSSYTNFSFKEGNHSCPLTSNQFVNLSSDTSNCLWNFGDGQTSTLANPNHTYLTSGNYFVSLESNNTCGIKSIVTKLLTISNSNVPQAVINLGDNYQTCASQEILFQNNIFSPWNETSWLFSDSSYLNSPTVTRNFQSNGLQSVILEVSNNCGLASDARSILIFDTLNAPIVTCLSLDDKVIFNWNTIPLADFYEISMDNGVSWQATTDSSYTINNVILNDTITAIVHASGCTLGANSTPASCTITNLNNLAFPNKTIGIYPNPCTNFISFKNLPLQVHNIEIKDNVGRTVLCLMETKLNIPIDIGRLENGVYFVTINELNKTTTIKMIVLK